MFELVWLVFLLTYRSIVVKNLAEVVEELLALFLTLSNAILVASLVVIRYKAKTWAFLLRSCSMNVERTRCLDFTLEIVLLTHAILHYHFSL